MGAGGRAPRFQFTQETQGVRDPSSEASLFELPPQLLVLGDAVRLVVPHHVGARLKVQERPQVLAALSRQWLRTAKHANGVERENAQDSQRRSRGHGKEERRTAEQACDGHEPGL